jgi:hypothetical protein
MAHEIIPGPHPNIVIMRVFDRLEIADINVDKELGVDRGKRFMSWQMPPSSHFNFHLTCWKH